MRQLVPTASFHTPGDGYGPARPAVSRLRALAAEAEVVVTGIEISSWGRDLEDPDRPQGCLHRRTGCCIRLGAWAPDHHRGVLPPGGRLRPLPPVPLDYAVRMRRHPEANEPEIRYHSIAVRCAQSQYLTAVCTDLIGFPEETEEFAQTLDFIRRCMPRCISLLVGPARRPRCVRCRRP